MSSKFAGWWMVVIAFVAQNAAIGANFGAYGTMVPTIQADFHTSWALAASGPSVMTLAMG